MPTLRKRKAKRYKYVAKLIPYLCRASISFGLHAQGHQDTRGHNAPRHIINDTPGKPLINDMKGKKTGGRQKGTPNKENRFITEMLKKHSNEYFTPTERFDDEGNIIVASDFDVDLACLDVNDRITAELKILEYHTPKMKSMEIDMTVTADAKAIETHLASLAGEDDDPEDSDD